MPYDKGYADCIKVTELGLPERVAGMIYKTRSNRYQYPKKWNKDKAKTNVIDFDGISYFFRRIVNMFHQPVFPVWSFFIYIVKIMK
jgi:hypothetical protein